MAKWLDSMPLPIPYQPPQVGEFQGSWFGDVKEVHIYDYKSNSWTTKKVAAS